MNRRKNRLAAQLALFAQQYKRKAQRNAEPNDRRYSREAEAEMKRLPPELLSELLNEETEATIPEVHPNKPAATDLFAKYKRRRP